MKSKGMTLIEVLVVVSMVIIVTGAIILNNSSSNSGIHLLNAKNSIITEIAKAKELALSGVGAIIGANYGIGVWFNSDGKNYYIYKNLDDDMRFTDANDVILSEIMLPEGIKYETQGDYMGVLFVPPTPFVAICDNSNCDGNLFELNVFKESDVSNKHLIKVNKAGLIE